MKSSIIRVLLIIVGAFGVIVTTAYDFVRPGPAGFGRMQFMGFIISILFLMGGLRRKFHSRQRQFDTIMLWIYLLGLFYLVLAPGFSDSSHKRLLEVTAFLPIDFGINIVGFFPLGYLLLSLLEPDKGGRFGRYSIAILSSLILSLLIEVAQYFIPGRTSAINDLVANWAGGGVGVLCYHFEGALFRRQQKSSARWL